MSYWLFFRVFGKKTNNVGEMLAIKPIRVRISEYNLI